MEDIPKKVSINEAVNLSKEFSEEDSFGFVNSVLDKILIEKSPRLKLILKINRNKVTTTLGLQDKNIKQGDYESLWEI